jgi:hypothetical protein
MFMNAFRPGAEITTEAFLAGQPETAPIGSPLGTDDIRFPSNASNTDLALDYHLLARHTFTDIYEDIATLVAHGGSHQVPSSVQKWIRRNDAHSTASLITRAANIHQKRYVISRYAGEPYRLDLIDDLKRIRAGGSSGPGIYHLLAKARNVDGRNEYLASGKFSRNDIYDYTGSSWYSNQKFTARSMSLRIKQHGVSIRRFWPIAVLCKLIR